MRYMLVNCSRTPLSHSWRSPPGLQPVLSLTGQLKNAGEGQTAMLTREDTLPSTEVILGRIIMDGVEATANILIKGHLLISRGEVEDWRDLHHQNSSITMTMFLLVESLMTG